jgi:hypothetical protein
MRRSAGHAVVSAAAARLVPYPYVYVNDDGTVRELHAAERQHLEARFPSSDGARPSVKSTFHARDGRGGLRGFCRRSKVPRDVLVAPAPATSPNPPLSMVELQRRMQGLQVTAEPGGTLQIKRNPETPVPWKAWLMRRLTKR